MNDSQIKLERLKQLSGTFPADASTRVFRIIFMISGFGFLPFIALAALCESLSWDSIVISVILILFGLGMGYICWRIKGHRYEFRDGAVYSIGRKVLWSVALSEVQSIREWKGGGGFSIWWMRTLKGERGLVLSKSLKKALFHLDDRGGV